MGERLVSSLLPAPPAAPPSRGSCCHAAFAAFRRTRWWLFHPLQQRVPCGAARCARRLGRPLTYGEVLFFWCPLCYGIMNQLLSNLCVPGWKAQYVAGYFYVAALMTAARNSLFTWLVGIPFERALTYHRIVSSVAVLGSFSHVFSIWQHQTHHCATPTKVGCLPGFVCSYARFYVFIPQHSSTPAPILCVQSPSPPLPSGPSPRASPRDRTPLVRPLGLTQICHPTHTHTHPDTR